VRCGIGSCGVPRPRLADYVMGTETTRGQPLPEGASVDYPPNRERMLEIAGTLFASASWSRTSPSR
jgi:hypothetical protein